MPHMTLPSGTQILLGVFHEDTEVMVKVEGKSKPQPMPTMQTRVRVTKVIKVTETKEITKTVNGRDYHKRVYETGDSCETKAVCSISDPFNRATGRYIAARRILKMDMIRLLTKPDRKAIMKQICPELFQSKEDIERAVYTRLARKFNPAQEEPKVA